MPTAIFVSGPTRIDWYDGSVWTELGECDNDNLPQATWNDYQHEVRTSSSGGTPEEIVLQNTDGAITFTLVKWDATELAQLEARQRGAQVLIVNPAPSEIDDQAHRVLRGTAARTLPLLLDSPRAGA